MKPCKHLDYEEGKYSGCTLRTCAPHYPDVRYWERGREWTHENGVQVNPQKVQFCGQGRGRINAVFDCYDGSMGCYEPADPTNGDGRKTT